MSITIAEMLLLLVLGYGLYLALRPFQRWLERRILNWISRDSGRKGQGRVYTIKRDK